MVNASKMFFVEIFSAGRRRMADISVCLLPFFQAFFRDPPDVNRPFDLEKGRNMPVFSTPTPKGYSNLGGSQITVEILLFKQKNFTPNMMTFLRQNDQ